MMELCAETGDYAFHQRLRNQGRLPLSVSIELTERCNLNCQHCYINLPAHDAVARQRELTTAECKHIFDQLAQAGTLWLLLTGGELMLRPDFEELYCYARDCGFILTIYTNGTMITPRRADFLAQYPPFLLEITLYGATRETYELVTRVPGSYDRCMAGLELLHQRRLPVKLKTVAMTLNAHELEAMQAIAERYGWEFRYDAMIHPRLNGDRTPTTLRLSPEAIVALEQLDVRRVEEWQEYCSTFIGQQVKGGPHTLTCGAAANSCHVDAYGAISPCMLTRTHAAEWRDSDVATIWNEQLAAVRETRNTAATACHSCELSLLCTNCPGWSVLERGTLEQRPVDWVCRTTQARAAAFAPQAAEWQQNALILEPVQHSAAE